ncbi:MAG: thioesterase family protein [Proteobacteria bacterium]|nr:thioesterase family protein [Pseudomonadota bacterium]
MSTHPIPAWDGHDFDELLALDALADSSGPAGSTTFRTRCGDANNHGRAYGGQILAQALAAAARTVPAERACTAMQFMFLQGTLWDEALDLVVTPLQDGKRFASRHVRGVQRGQRLVLDAQVSFALPTAAPAHGAAPPVALEDPEQLPSPADLPAEWQDAVKRAVGYHFELKPALDFRLAAPPPNLALELPEPRIRFWIRARRPLGDDAALHAAVFAYLSDWWVNYPATGGHQAEAQAKDGLYVASLNHAMWLHRPVRADEWLHFDSISPAAAAGRGLSVARVHDRQGQLVASATQECLMVPREG